MKKKKASHSVHKEKDSVHKEKNSVHKDWEILEIVDEMACLQIEEIEYFVDKEEACLAHSVLLLKEQLKKIVDNLEFIANELLLVQETVEDQSEADEFLEDPKAL